MTLRSVTGRNRLSGTKDLHHVHNKKSADGFYIMQPGTWLPTFRGHTASSFGVKLHLYRLPVLRHLALFEVTTSMLEGSNASLLRLKIFLLRQLKVDLHLRKLMINFRRIILSPSPKCKCSYVKQKSVYPSEKLQRSQCAGSKPTRTHFILSFKKCYHKHYRHRNDYSELSRCVWCVCGCVCVCLCASSIFDTQEK